MAKAATQQYDDLIFQLGDLARERLVNRADSPRGMERVLKAEDALLQRREEQEELERQMNDEAALYEAFLEQQEAEREEQRAIVKKWRRAVDGVEGRTKEIRKKIGAHKVRTRYERQVLKQAEEKHRDLEMTRHYDQAKIDLSRENLKKLRLAQIRRKRELEEMEAVFQSLLTPTPGQPGAQGILAHRRLLEMEDEALERKLDHEEKMRELDGALAAKDPELQAAEDYLDQALFLLGEEVYSHRVSDPALSPLYAQIDKLR